MEAKMRADVRFFPIAVAVVFASSPVAFAEEGWSNYKSDEYGFEMLVPEGTKFTEKESEGGWGELVATHEGVTLYALGKLGAPEKAEAIEKHGVKVTGIAADKWKVLDKGKDTNGWKWFYTVEARDGDNIVFGGYGVGSKGSYMIVMKTTAADYKESKKDYDTWYKSVKLF
jgi:hypothetical protein